MEAVCFNKLLCKNREQCQEANGKITIKSCFGRHTRGAEVIYCMLHNSWHFVEAPVMKATHPQGLIKHEQNWGQRALCANRSLCNTQHAALRNGGAHASIFKRILWLSLQFIEKVPCLRVRFTAARRHACDTQHLHKVLGFLCIGKVNKSR